MVIFAALAFAFTTLLISNYNIHIFLACASSLNAFQTPFPNPVSVCDSDTATPENWTICMRSVVEFGFSRCWQMERARKINYGRFTPIIS